MGFDGIFWKDNIQKALLPKTSISEQIASEILDQLSSSLQSWDDTIKMKPF